MKVIKRTCGLHWLAILLVITLFLFSAGYTAAQDIKGYVITEDGRQIPDEAPSVTLDGKHYFVQRDAEKAVRELNDLHKLGLAEFEIAGLA